MTDALKPCPFCGSDDVEALDMEGKHYVVCYDCALEGPLHESRAAVVAAWNRRALAAPAVPVAWHCPRDPDSATAFFWRRPMNGLCPNCVNPLVPLATAGARTDLRGLTFELTGPPVGHWSNDEQHKT